MNQRTALAVAALAVCAGLAYFLSGRAPPAGDAGEPAPVADAPSVAAEVARVRTEARARGEIDLSPCSAAGRVVDADTGKPIAGALVMLRPRGLDRPTGPGDSGAPLTATTDASGDWTLPALPPGRYVLTATAADYLPGRRTDLSLKAGTPNPGLDLALARGGHPLRGTVSDVSGGAIEGAVITIDRQDEGNVINFSRAAYPAISDDEGRFVVQVPDGVYTVGAWHPDYTGDSQSADVAGGPRTVALRMIPAGVIEGTVRAEQDGAPIAGAIVSDGGAGGFGGDTAATDAAGRFRLAHLRPGAHRLSAVAAGHASREPQTVELGIGENVDGVELRVDRAYTISGFVVPRDDPRRSLDGVMVAAYSLQPMAMQPATGPSAVDGYFEIFGVKPGTYTLGSVAEDALPEILGGPTVTIERADVTGVVIQLDRGVALRGRVDPPGPAAITLALADEDPGFFGMLAALGNMFVRGRADARGEFTLRPVKPGRLRVVAEAIDGARGQLDVDVGAKGEDGLVVALEPRASVTGRVVDARGNPLTSGAVEFQPLKRKDNAINFSIGMGQQGRAPIGEDGQYTLRGLDGGDYDVRVFDRGGNVVRWSDPAADYKPVRKTISAAVLNPGHDLAVELRDGVLRGTVVDQDGAVVADAWVTATPRRASDAEAWYRRPEEERPAERVGVVPALPKDDDDDDASDDDFGVARGEPTLTDERGRFELTGLARRKHTLRVEALRGSARARLPDVEVGGDITVKVLPLAEVDGTVRVGGKPVARYDLTLRRKGGFGFGRDSKSVDRPDGAFHLDHLDPGEYTVVVNSDAGHLDHPLTLAPGQRAALSLELRPWGRLRGVLVDARTGQPLAGMTVTARQKDVFQAGAMFETLLGRGPRTDATGRFEVPKIAGGEGTLEIFDGDVTSQRTVAEVEFQLEDGAEKDLGTIQGVAAAKIPKAERGELGLRLQVSTAARRPLPPGSTAPPLEKKEDPAAPKHLYVLAVTIDGPADKAGIQPGDEILAIEGAGVAGLGVDNAERMLGPASVRRGQSLALELEQAGSRQTVTVEARERSD